MTASTTNITFATGTTESYVRVGVWRRRMAELSVSPSVYTCSTESLTVGR
jgi:hypothetical protein